METLESLMMQSHSPDVTAVINAGGRATRMNGIFAPDAHRGIAKAVLMDVGTHSGGKPLIALDHQLNQLSSVPEIDKIVVSAGDQHTVSEYVDEHYEDSRIRTISSERTYGTAGDLIMAVRERPDLFGETILVGNVDTIVRIDYAALLNFFAEKDGDAAIALTSRKDAKNADAFFVGRHGHVVHSDEFESQSARHREIARPFMVRKGASTGVVVLRRTMIEDAPWKPEDGEYSLYSGLLSRAIGARGLYAFDNGDNFVRDVATKKTWARSENDAELQAQLWYSTSK